MSGQPPPCYLAARVDALALARDRHEERIVALGRLVDDVRAQIATVASELVRQKVFQGKQAAPAPAPAAPAASDAWGMSTSEICRKYSIQACHHCERLACGDNTSPGAELLRAARAVLTEPGGALHVTLSGLDAAVRKVEAVG